jgi:hypothetical protein
LCSLEQWEKDMSAGIDYGMGTSNRDAKTGIRYGVISQHSINPDVLGDFEFIYPDPTEEDYEEAAKEAGWTRSVHNLDVFVDSDGNNLDDAKVKTWEALCIADGIDVYCSDMCEPIGQNYEGDGYKLTDCLDSDIFVLESPFYTHAEFCSPCVPGAGNLDSPDDDGAKTYCLGHDWFEDGKAPYKVYAVNGDYEVVPKLNQDVA